MAKILVTDDEKSLREFLEILLVQDGHEVLLAQSVQEAISFLNSHGIDLLITDLRLGADSGLDLLSRAKSMDPKIEVIVVTAYGSTENAIAAMKFGAYDYVTKPFQVDELRVLISKALEHRSLLTENELLKTQLNREDFRSQLVGQSRSMMQVSTIIEKVAPTRTTVLITGESGVGKELVARAIHSRSPRKKAPFVAVNCGAIPEGLLESELFGHVKGAFTGASQNKTGLFQAADGGTLLLDEIGELPLSLQVKILRALQDRRVKPVGGVDEQEVDVRIVAATNRDLLVAIKEGSFREDLFYRLNVVQIHVPPLRERAEDIVLLSEFFLKKTAAEHGRSELRFSKEVLHVLSSYAFPGNVRELQNIVERAVTFSDGEFIQLDDLPSHVVPMALRPLLPPDTIPVGFDLQKYLEDLERSYLLKAMEQSKGIKLEAAKVLGLSFRSFRYRYKKVVDQSAADIDDPLDDV